MSSPCIYLILAEIFNKGYVIDIKDTLEEAEQAGKELLDKYIHRVQEIEEIAATELQYLYSYPKNGNALFFGEQAWLLGGNAFNVIVAEVEKSRYCLKSFMAERANHSHYLVFDKKSEALDRYVELFPDTDMIAN